MRWVGRTHPCRVTAGIRSRGRAARRSHTFDSLGVPHGKKARSPRPRGGRGLSLVRGRSEGGDACVRPERGRDRPVDVAGDDPVDARRDLDPTGSEPVRIDAVRDPVQARDLRIRREPARVPGRLLHAGRRPRCITGRRGRERRDRRLQPVRLGRRLQRHRQLLAVALESDAERHPAEHAAELRAVFGRPVHRRLRQLSRDLGRLAGGADAPGGDQRQRRAAGLLLADRLRERRLLRRRHVQRRRRQLRPTAVFHKEQHDRQLEQRCLEPGVPWRHRCARDELGCRLEPVHERSRDARLGGRAVPDDRRERYLERLRSRRAAELGRPVDGGRDVDPALAASSSRARAPRYSRSTQRLPSARI